MKQVSLELGDKACSCCKRYRPLDCFFWKSRERGWRCSVCCDCMKPYRRAHYANSKGAYKARAVRRNIATRAANKHRMYELLSQKRCVDCGEDDPDVLDFDHVRGTKRMGVSIMVAQAMAWATITDEIAKCEVRCANCHRRKTAAERGWSRRVAHQRQAPTGFDPHSARERIVREGDVEDLTKLSGPELAELARDMWTLDDDGVLDELLRRVEEDDRVAMRNLERERDGLRERVRELECTCDQLRASCNNQRKELHSMNVERKATLTKLEDAQRRIAELEAQLREAVNAGADEWTADGEAVPEPAERKAPSTGEWVRNAKTGRVGRVYTGPLVVPVKGYSYVELGDVIHSWADHLCEPCDPPESADSKASVGHRYGREGFSMLTLDEIEMDAGNVGRAHVLDVCAHLRRTVATIDAAEALVAEWDARNTCLFGSELSTADRMVCELREVLNGKR